MLEVRQLDVFHGDAQALWGVDLSIGDGEVVGVVGPNGSGKSTLVNTIAGLHRSVRGNILVDGAELTSVAPHRVCEHGVATVPEGRRVFPRMSVYDNLCLGAYRKGAGS